MAEAFPSGGRPALPSLPPPTESPTKLVTASVAGLGFGCDAGSSAGPAAGSGCAAGSAGSGGSEVLVLEGQIAVAGELNDDERLTVEDDRARLGVDREILGRHDLCSLYGSQKIHLINSHALRASPMVLRLLTLLLLPRSS